MKIKMLMVVAMAFAFAAQSASADDLLESDVVGIKVAFQGLLMIPGGLPWVVAKGETEVSEDGEFDVELARQIDSTEREIIRGKETRSSSHSGIETTVSTGRYVAARASTGYSGITTGKPDDCLDTTTSELNEILGQLAAKFV